MKAVLNPLRSAISRSAKRSRPSGIRAGGRCCSPAVTQAQCNVALFSQAAQPKAISERSPVPPLAPTAFPGDEEALTPSEERAKDIDALRARVLSLKETLPTDAPEVKAAEAELLKLRQIALENDTLEQATEKYRRIMGSMIKMEMSSSLSALQRQIVDFYVPLVEAIDAEQRAIEADQKSPDRFMYGPFMQLLPPDKIAVIVMHTVINTTVAAGDTGASFPKICLAIAGNIEAEVNMEHLSKKYGKSIVSRLMQGGALRSQHINQRAKMSLDSGEWASELKVKLGAVLCKLFVTTAKKKSDGKPAFTHKSSQLSFKKQAGLLFADPEVYSMLVDVKADPSGTLVANMTRYLPMLVEPKPWVHYDEGGYLQVKSKVMRTKGGREQTEVLKHAPLERVFEGLNALGRLPWVIHGEVLGVFQSAYDSKVEIAGLPSQTDLEVPVNNLKKPPFLSKEEFKAMTEEQRVEQQAWRDAVAKVKRVKMRNAELHSLRCDTSIKLKQASDFKDEEKLYFPYNMDFRGRAYPIPPNLNHLGNDMCRGLLKFSEKKELGHKGLFWLKVQLASLYGFDKASFPERAAWTEERMSQVYDSALKPLEGDRWWAEAENPGQALAACMEIVEAFESTGGKPELFRSNLPVHMDGSCNGLQHYAALGRDFEGGKQVNLVNGSRPRDVYAGVCSIVVSKVATEAARILGPDASEQEVRDHESAKLVNGLIDRKVVKQTVMTSVYGVTFIGARKQIQSRLEEKLKGTTAGDMDEEELEKLAYGAATYLAHITMEALTELFTGARGIMEWLGSCAQAVAKQGQPMSWVTPLGLPVSQPYRKGGNMMVRTVMQTIQVVHNSDDLKVNSQRQRSAFPPNFVHSLDSTHMLLTAINMQRKGLAFTAVHDSYWTHPSDVDDMNESLRSSFVKLYSEPILEDLHQQLSIRFPGAEFPALPERGELDIRGVSDSTYFFN